MGLPTYLVHHLNFRPTVLQYVTLTFEVFFASSLRAYTLICSPFRTRIACAVPSSTALTISQLRKMLLFYVYAYISGRTPCKPHQEVKVLV